MRIREALEIPEVTDLDEFITRLDTRDPARIRRDLAQFVMAPKVFEQVDQMLATVGKRFEQGLDVGRFIYGNFGSGKSHLMAVLGKMFERDETVYEVGDPALRDLRGRHPWIDRRKTLVVRLNMMEKKTLVQALYEAFNAALPADVPPVMLTDQERVFELIAADAQRMGGLDALLDRAVADGAIPTREFYERHRHGTLKQQLALAARLATWRDHGARTIRPEDLWVDAEEGFRRLAEHARDHGYQSVVWLIDELIIWIRGKARHEYVDQINVLSALVDHDNRLARPLPFFVVVAVQQDIRQTCPDDLSEQSFHEQLGFISDRFRPWIELQDQDLYEVAARRVLKPKPEAEAAFRQAVDATFRKHGEAIRELSGDLEPDFVRRLYPFHPALLRALVDVTQALSRNRTAMAALYGLLDRYHQLEVGQFIPLGSLYEILFTRGNVDSIRDRKSELAQRFVSAFEAYERLEGKIDDAARSMTGSDPAELHQLVRTVLMCQLSDKRYFPDGESLSRRITATTLFRLNQSDVRALSERTGISKVIRLFRRLASSDAQVQVSGDERDPHIAIKTERIDIEAVLSTARGELVHADRFAYCRRLLDAQLGLRLGNVNEAARVVRWRGTKRRGRVRLANVRRLTYAGTHNEFDAGDDAFLILVDYPFDEDPACGRQDDITAIQNARKRKRQWTVAWLPEHFTDTERKALDNAAAIERIRGDKRRYLADYNAREAMDILRALEAFQVNQDAILEEAIRRVYFVEGQVHACSDLLDKVTQEGKDPAKAIDAMAREILDARYPRHPTFKRDVRSNDLGLLAEWVVRAAVTGEAVDLRAPQLDLVEALGVPLQIVWSSNSSVTRRLDGQFLRAIHEWIGDRNRFRAGDLRKFLADEGKQGFGFTDEVFQFFAYYLLQAEGYEAQGAGGEGLTIEGLGGIGDNLTFVKAVVVDAPTWDKARAVARALLGVKGRADVPSVPEQSKLSRDVKRAADRRHGAVRRLADRLAEVCRWAGVDPEKSKRARTLAALLDDLSSLAGDLDHAGRVRQLAALHGAERLEDFAHLAPPAGDDRRPDESGERPIDPVVAELSALTTIDHQKLAFDTVAARGTEEQRKQVVTALRNLLADPVSRPLAEHAERWARLAKTVAETLIIREPPPPPPPPPPPEDSVTVARSNVTRDQAEAIVRQLLEQALAKVNADTMALSLTLTKVKTP